MRQTSKSFATLKSTITTAHKAATQAHLAVLANQIRANGNRLGWVLLTYYGRSSFVGHLLLWATFYYERPTIVGDLQAAISQELHGQLDRFVRQWPPNNSRTRLTWSEGLAGFLHSKRRAIL